MTYAFKCTMTGLCDFSDVPGPASCPMCGGQHETFAAGGPPIARRNFAGSAAVQTYRPRMMYGQLVTSRRQEDALDAARGIVTITEREARDNSPPADTRRFPRRRVS